MCDFRPSFEHLVDYIGNNERSLQKGYIQHLTKKHSSKEHQSLMVYNSYTYPGGVVFQLRCKLWVCVKGDGSLEDIVIHLCEIRCQ